MEVIVAQLVELSKPHARQRKLMNDLAHVAAHPGMHFIINGKNENIFGPAALFMLSRHRDDGRITDENPFPSTATSRATAYELAEFLKFLVKGRKSWKKVSHRTLLDYARLLVDTESPITGRLRVAKTVGHKFSTILSFYRFTNAAKLTNPPISWDAKSLSTKWRKGRGAKQGNKLKEGQIRPFIDADLERMAKDLGPLPTERPTGSLRPCRDRLIVQTGLGTGMRVEEICHLSAKAISRLKVDPAHPDGLNVIDIHRTKGKLSRRVSLRNKLVLELQEYIRIERRVAMRRRGMRAADHDFLFVNHEEASRPGSPLKTSGVHKMFRALMVRLKFTKPVPRKRDGVTDTYLLSTHSFHDLRHTFAVKLYLKLKALAASEDAYREAVSEPWAAVAVALGHTDWTTTKEVYLKAPGLYLAAIGERQHEYLKGEAA